MPGHSSAEYQREWRALNPERARGYDAKRWADGSLKLYRDRCKIEIESRRLERRFGITMEIYISLLLDQGCRCAICGRHQTEFEQAFVVDHDRHCCPGEKSCGMCVRGLLCTSCNLIIGNAGDSIVLLEAAIVYIRRMR